jgi:hypothetical protein
VRVLRDGVRLSGGCLSKMEKKDMRDLTLVCIYAAHCVVLALDVCMYSTSKYTDYIRYEGYGNELYIRLHMYQSRHQ